jgi:hypothetical protein
VCHSYMTGLIGGSIGYNPEPLERPAPGNVLVCYSQPEANVFSICENMTIAPGEIIDVRPGIEVLSLAVDSSADFRLRIQG